jgi:uncharacterized protein (TIGR02996 family)
MDPMLAALAANPRDDLGWRVYADWLEEQADARAEFLRLGLSLAEGSIAPDQVESAATRLHRLAKKIDPDWREQVARLRANLPMRFRITSVQILGNIPPQEMFDRAMTLVNGVLESGAVRLRDEVLIPLEGEGPLQAIVTSLFDWRSDYEEVMALGEPLFFGMMWRGHRHGIQTLATIVKFSR